MNYRIFPPEGILETTINLPLSKSIAARVIVMNALAAGPDSIDTSRMPDCIDTRVLLAAVSSCSEEVSAHQSGTAMRFLTAYFAVKEGCDVVLTGDTRLLERPISKLVNALRSLGADIEYTDREGHLPLRIRGRHLKGGAVRLDARESSQFASALAMIAPLTDEGLAIDLGGEIASMPYLRMTMRMLENRGVEADLAGYTLTVKGKYGATPTEVEPDWSAASYWYEIAAVTAGWVTLPGLAPDSLQGDSVLARIGERFGAVTEFTEEGAELSATPDIYSRLDLDLSDYPDLLPALAVTACLTGIPCHFTGLGNLRIKESDRIAAVAEGLAALGCPVETGTDYIRWEGAREPIVEMPSINPHGDHRIAMAFSAASVFVPGMIIEDIEVTDKSYPGFWDDLRTAGFTLTDASVPLPDPIEEA